MPNFKHILFPVDFSAQCRALRPLVMAAARQFGSRITLLHVIQIPAEWYGLVEGLHAGAADVAALEKTVHRELADFLEPPQPPVRFACVIQKGDPADCITSCAASLNVDLIMMPTRGYGAFRSLLLGSVAAKVLHDAACPVWTTAHLDDPDLALRFPPKNILCAIDTSAAGNGANLESLNLIHCAEALAGRFGADLRLVHGVVGASASAQNYLDTDFNHFLLQAGLEAVAKLQREADTGFDVVVKGGRVASVVSEAAALLSADLVVIGRGRLREKLGRLRNNAYAIIRDSPCPVLSL